MPRFAGFTTDQQKILLGKMGYAGPSDQDEIDKFLAASPAAAAKLGKYTSIARQRVEGKPLAKAGMAEGGTVNPLDNAYIGTPESDPNAKSGIPEDVITTKQITESAVNTPTSMVATPQVEKVATNQDQLIDQNTGKAQEVSVVTPQTVTDIANAAAAPETPVSTVTASTVGDKAKEGLANLQAATAEPSAKATVQGQLESLMADFEKDGTPPWASGAMRRAMTVMQQRGLGASSMAGSAVVQAAMESAIGIAAADAQTVAAFEMASLTNRQQTAIYKSQQTIASMFSDQAAENAAAQFNAANENQTKQFFADLQTVVSRFNAEQVNSIRSFNAGQTNVVEQFNSQLKAQRDQFNAQNDLIIAQANTKWRQSVATLDTAAQNEANLETARQANSFTQRTLDQIWQRERDLMNFAFLSSENEEERNLKLLLADKNINAQEKSDTTSALGYLAGRLLFGGLG